MNQNCDLKCINKASTLPSFQSVREKASSFCTERNWEKFHLPTSLTLALSGECGEVCEIFQWKGQLEEELLKRKDNKQDCVDLTQFRSDEVVHIGEEIADVFIYTIRLCDVCQIDLAKSVYLTMEQCGSNREFNPGNPSSIIAPRASMSDEWMNLDFNTVDSFVSKEILPKFRSHRHLSLELQRTVGHIAELFSRNPEGINTNGLALWSSDDLSRFSSSSGYLILILMCIAKMSNLGISHCLADKYGKNEAKYPVQFAKGSSAKYTTYVNQKKRVIKVATSQIAIGIIGIVLGYFLRSLQSYK